MNSWPFDIQGKEPRHLIGLPCEAILFQEYWYKGALAESPNVIYMKFGEGWYTLRIDAGVVFWGAPMAPPERIPDQGEYSYPIIDMGMSSGLKGQVLADIGYCQIPGGGGVVLAFDSGVNLTVRNVEDLNTYVVGNG